MQLKASRSPYGQNIPQKHEHVLGSRKNGAAQTVVHAGKQPQRVGLRT